MTKREVEQKSIVKYAMLKGKLKPRDSVLKEQKKRPIQPTQPTHQDDFAAETDDVDYEQMTVKQLKEVLDEKGVDYDKTAKKDDLVLIALDNDFAV